MESMKYRRRRLEESSQQRAELLQQARAAKCRLCEFPLVDAMPASLLPCAHSVHRACAEGLYTNFGVRPGCPICRQPPHAAGPESEYDDLARRFFVLEAQILRRPQAWLKLPSEQQRTLDQLFAAWRGAAESGVLTAQYSLGLVFESGRGVLPSKTQALRWYKKAASSTASFEAAVAASETERRFEASFYRFFAVDESVREGRQEWGRLSCRAQAEVNGALVVWRELAAVGCGPAQYALGLVYETGRGVPQSTDNALCWFRMAAAAACFGHGGE
jgi:hypothetical protein